METIRAIIAAVRTDGFSSRLPGDGSLRLEGSVVVAGHAVPLEIRFVDLSLAECPRVYVPDTSMLARNVVPHVDDKGELCVVDRSFHVFDRLRAPEQVRGLIRRAAEVLTHGNTKAGTEEIAREFPAYWATTQFELTSESGASADGKAGKANIRSIDELTTAARLSFEPHHSKPATLGAFLDWAAHWDANLVKRLSDKLARLNFDDPTILIHAANGSIAATLRVSGRGPALSNAFKRPGAWQKFLASPAARSLPIERSLVRPHDLMSILGANGKEGRPPLANKRILLIGCGAIGGYLARMLAQLGAGHGADPDGRLTLVDHDRLDMGNIRRHQLGSGDNKRAKAEALAELIGRDFPGTSVKSFTGEAQQNASIFSGADLIIDATGEHGLSEWLNGWALGRRAAGEAHPAILFAWIAGAGAAVQTFMMIAAATENHACYRCLQPDLRELARFDPLRESPAEPVQPCGGHAYTPYGPAASGMAASLGAAHASDWAENRPHPLMRTVRIDWAATVRRDPKSPERAKNCPACGGQ